MLPTDLRFGNYVTYQGEIIQIYGVKGLYAFFAYEDGDEVKERDIVVTFLEGITLTPEIFEKIGLIATGFKDGDSKLYQAPEHIREESAKDVGTRYCSFFFNERLNKWMDSQTRVAVSYLHQLQNLYFALTGEELLVNL